MKCPTADSLAQYYDEILSREQAADIEMHVMVCASCQQVLQLYKEEEQFIHETLQTPTLPDTFDDAVLAKLTPYKKRKSRLWKRSAAAAATVLLAGGIALSVTPSFATFVQSLFASPSADPGLHMALESGAVIPVNIEVTSGNLTLLVEDTLVDTSRIGFTYRVLKGNGKYADPYFEPSQDPEFTFTDANGNELTQVSMLSWSRIDEKFGMFLFDLPRDFEHDEFTLSFNVKKVGFRSVDWDVEIPFNLSEARKQVKAYAQNASHEVDGVAIELHDFRFTSSQTNLAFTSKFTDEELVKIKSEREQLATTYGPLFFEHDPDISFVLENEEGEVVASSDFTDGQWISSQGEMLGNGVVARVHRFAPLHDAGNLTFVLKGIYKPRPVEITAPLKKGSTIEVEGYELKVEDVKFVKKLKERYIEAKIVGETAPELLNSASWRATSEGKSFDAFMSGGTDIPLEGSDLVGIELDIRIYGLDDVPEDLTIAITELVDYKPLEQPWRMPLME